MRERFRVCIYTGGGRWVPARPVGRPTGEGEEGWVEDLRLALWMAARVAVEGSPRVVVRDEMDETVALFDDGRLVFPEALGLKGGVAELERVLGRAVHAARWRGFGG